MATLHDKNSARLEVVRYLRDDIDPWFAPVLNRPIEDLSQRTVDLNLIHHPARWFYAHGPSVLSVIVDPGWLSLDYRQSPIYYPGDTVAILLSTPGNIRIDLVYLDMLTQGVGVSQGVEVLDTTAFPTLFADKSKLGVLPLSSIVLPICYVYVDSSATRTYTHTLPNTSAGYIRDARLAPGSGSLRFEDDVSALMPDTAGGSTGAAPHLVRIGHRHPTLYSTANPATLIVDGSSGQGSSDFYALVGHVHPLEMLTNPLLLGYGAGSAYVGDPNDYTFVRGDHAHGTIHGATTPEGVGYGIAATPGSAVEPILLSHEDHVHAVNSAGTVIVSKHFTFSWVDESDARSTGALGFTPTGAILLGAMIVPATPEIQGASVGMIVESGSCRGSTCVGWYNVDDMRWGVAHDDNQSLGQCNMYCNTSFNGYAAIDITAWSSAGVQLTPTTLARVRVNIIVFGVT
jgi:hypothetical protein